MFGFLIPVVVDKSGSMEESRSDVNGDGVDGFKGVTQKAGDDSPVVVEGFNGRGAEDLDETSVFEEDGSGLREESVEVVEVEVRVVEGISELLASRAQVCRGRGNVLAEQAGSEGSMLAREGGVQVVARTFRVVHGGGKQKETGEARALGGRGAKVSCCGKEGV